MLALLAFSGLARGAHAATGETAAASANCAQLASFGLAGGAIDDARLVAGQPGYCRVTFTLTPSADSAIRAELWLPAPERWNGKFQGVGNGGLAGDIPQGPLEAGLARGYATAATDTGHDNAAGVGRFALGHPEKIVDYGHRAIHLTAVAGQAITTAYYGRKPRHRYFVGCSQGGQEALMEAQRYPADYDGIVAGDPDYNQTHHEVGAHLWVVTTLYGSPGSQLGEAQARLVGEAVNRACDALDGVEDGVLEDPRRCKFDPAALQCRTADATDCLSAAQAQAVRRLWDGPDAEAGMGYYPGLERGGKPRCGAAGSSRTRPMKMRMARSACRSSGISSTAIPGGTSTASTSAASPRPSTRAWRARSTRLIRTCGRSSAAAADSSTITATTTPMSHRAPASTTTTR